MSLKEYMFQLAYIGKLWSINIQFSYRSEKQLKSSENKIPPCYWSLGLRKSTYSTKEIQPYLVVGASLV